ncbi:MAG: hypothetical protein JOZ54_07755 [Acidobacteria bacterium]|nr:hypothetical protein [Acidobacteriota bacterium]
MKRNFLRHLSGLVMLVVSASSVQCTNDDLSVASTRPQAGIVRVSDSAEARRIRAAADFNARYHDSRFASWRLHADAAGELCNVLVVKTPIVLDVAMVDAVHYGTGDYDLDRGGIQRFYLEQTFRGVAYHDGSDRVWTFGAVKSAELEKLAPCR